MPAPGTRPLTFNVCHKQNINFFKLIFSIIYWGFFNGYANFHKNSSLRKGNN